MPTANALWLALLTLEVEHEILEIQTKLWPELLRQLQEVGEKFSMDAVIKVILYNSLNAQSENKNFNFLYYRNQPTLLVVQAVRVAR